MSRPSTSSAGFGVEVSGRLVGKDDGRLGSERTRDGDPLLLTAGEVVGQVFQLALQTQRFDDAVDVGGIGCLTVQLHRQDNIFKDIQHWHQIVVLKDEADLSSAEDGQFLILEGEDFLASTSTLPPVGRSSPPSICSRVDLPEPEVPTMATNSPFSTEKLMPSSA